MAEKSDQIADLLEQLKKAGADVKSGTESGPSVTTKTLDDLRGASPQEFEAWVSWTKSI